MVGKVLYERCLRHRRTEDIMQAYERSQMAFVPCREELESFARNDQEPPDYLVEVFLLSAISCCRVAFLQYGVHEDKDLLEGSIEIAEMSVFAIEEDHPRLATALGCCAQGLMIRLKDFGNRADLDVAIELFEAAVNLPSFDESADWQVHLWYAGALRLKFIATEDMQLLSLARNEVDQALEMKSHLVRQELFQCFDERFEIDYLQAMRDPRYSLPELNSQQLDVALLLHGFESNPFVATFYLQQTKLCLLLYRRLGEIYSLAQATSHIARAITLAAGDSCGMISKQEQLSIAYWNSITQYENFGKYQSVTALNEGIAFAREAVDGTKTCSISFVSRVVALCYGLRLQHQNASFTDSSLEECSVWLELASPAARPFSPREASSLHSELGEVEWMRLRPCQGPYTYQSVIGHFLSAIDASTIGIEIDSLPQIRLANVLVEKGVHTRDGACFEEAQRHLENYRTSLEARALGDGGSFIQACAWLIRSRYNLDPNPELARAWLRYAHIVLQKDFPPLTKINYAVEVADWELEFNHNINASVEAWKYALNQMVKVLSEALQRSEQLQIIRKYRYLPAATSIALFQQGAPASEVIRTLEASRSSIWATALNRQADLDRLQNLSHDLANRYQQIRSRLNSIKQQGFPERANEPTVIELSEALAAVIEEIRKEPGMEDFLLPPFDDAKLQQLSCPGPIVMPISGPEYGVALVICEVKTYAIKLPDFASEPCQVQAEKLQSALKMIGTIPDNEICSELESVFAWMWYSAAEPVLLSLFGPGDVGEHQHKAPGWLRTEFEKTTPQNRPRLWWITVGWVNLLPIHAAGIRRAVGNDYANSLDSVMDWVISSYAPTLRSLTVVSTVGQ
jgi:hypothetical protein